MNNIFETLFCWCVVAILAGTSLAQVDQSSDEASRDDADNKRGWNMLRWGRGLQMLRLGKRSANLDSTGFWRQGRSFSGHDNSRLSSSDIQDLLDSIFDDSREETRRQPPLPRYGRDSSRPAPRGGRYKRSLPTDNLTLKGRFSHRDHTRTMTFPRTEQATNHLANLQPRIVSGPRIEGIQNDASDDSSQSQSM